MIAKSRPQPLDILTAPGSAPGAVERSSKMVGPVDDPVNVPINVPIDKHDELFQSVSGLVGSKTQRFASLTSSRIFLLTTLMGCAMSSSAAVIAFLSLIALPSESDCTQSSTVKTDRQWFDCTHKALYKGTLDPVVKGLAIVDNWSPNDPLYYEAQSALAQWSRQVLNAAQQKANRDEFEAAIALVHHIPASSPNYGEAQTVMAVWQRQQHNAQNIVAIAQESLKQQDWQQVNRYLQELEGFVSGDRATERAVKAGGSDASQEGVQTVQTPHSPRSNPEGVHYLRQLSQQLRVEKESVTALDEVFQLAADGTPHHIGLALAKAMDIDPQSYAWQTAAPDLERYASQLLDDGHLQLQWEEWEDAIIIAQQVAVFPISLPT